MGDTVRGPGYTPAYPEGTEGPADATVAVVGAGALMVEVEEEEVEVKEEEDAPLVVL